jgi:hypothetical protein
VLLSRNKSNQDNNNNNNFLISRSYLCNTVNYCYLDIKFLGSKFKSVQFVSFFIYIDFFFSVSWSEISDPLVTLLLSYYNPSFISTN